MTDITPTVSVIVPNYNHAAFLKQRIDSIISQSYKDFELILLDDCSTDNSKEIMLSYKDNPHVASITINDQNSGSPFKQWITGINKARGQYIWIAESDDYAASDFLEKTVAQLDQHPTARICYTGSHLVDSNNNPLDGLYAKKFDLWNEDGEAYTINTGFYIREKIYHTNTTYNASMILFRKEGCLEDIDMKFAEMRYCGDWLFWISQILKGEYVVEIHQKLNYFRKHGYNTTEEGTRDFACLQEVLYIKNFLYSLYPTDRIKILADKYYIYRSVKRLKAKDRSKFNKLRKILKSYGFRYTDYLMGRYCRLYMRHIRKKK